MSNNRINLKNISNWPNHIVRFGKGFYAMRVVRAAQSDVRNRPYRNVCSTCGVSSGSRQCAETNDRCVSCVGWY